MNPLYKDFNMQAKNGVNPLEQFKTFMSQMKGRDPNQMINSLVSSGRVSQEQLNAVQDKARQMRGVFEPFFKGGK